MWTWDSFRSSRTASARPGDFAQAYVLAHEIGHHVQFLVGTESRVHRAMQERPDQANALSVAMELQADCYAGVWGHTAAAHGILETGDVEEGLGAAAAVGDDRLQRNVDRAGQSRRVHPRLRRAAVGVVPAGIEWRKLADCDTFAQ
jgi:predicted metalloprotease